MKQFLKFIFASCLGSLIAFSLVFLVFAIIVGSTSTPVAKISGASVLHLKLNYPVPELSDNVPKDQFAFRQQSALGLNDVTRIIRHAKDNDKIKGLFIQTESVSMNPTKAYALAREIENFKKSGKPVIAYGDYFSQSGYIFAAMADSIYLNPNGLIDLRGYGMVMPYYKEFSKKTGIEFDVYHAGKFKSAVEPYYLSESSLENREQSKQFLFHFHNSLVDFISVNRNLPEDQVNQIITQGLSTRANNALDYQLADELKYEEDVIEIIENVLGVDDINLITPEYYQQANPKKSKSHSNKIAVIYAEGEVAFSGDDKGNINMDVYDKVFNRLEKNKSVKGVVLRINSPGGSSLTSDKFWKRVEDLKKKGKYIVASFGDYAASGGYYVAAGADQIVSEPTTLTGSIGAYSMMPDFYKASKEHLGINWDTIGTGNRTFIYSSFVERDAADNALLQAETEHTYHQFKKVVSEGRSIEMRNLEKIAQGRVWSGIDAVNIGLVDTLGGLQDAINIAAEAVSYEDYKVLEYPIIKKTFWEQMAESIASGANVNVEINQPIFKVFSKEFNAMLEQIEAACSEPQLRMPYHIPIH